MNQKAVVVLIMLAVFVLFSAALIFINQVAQLVQLADRLHPVAGDAVLWITIAVVLIFVGVPVYLLLTLPRSLVPPHCAEGPEFERHLRLLKRRLASNPHLTVAPESTAELESALSSLDAIATERSKTAASHVFMTTAISQNGSLDALLVLAAQAKLVLEIARIYNQRPNLRELAFLYSNVAGSAFISAQLEDIDLAVQIQPILAAVLGSSISAIPGMGAAANLFVNSVTSGSGNAFLTLRVGILAQQYCRCLVRPEPQVVRRYAAVQALGMLGEMTKDGAAKVAAVIWAKPRQFFVDILSSVSGGISVVSSAATSTTTKTWNALVRNKKPSGEA